jgi:hypothetical protein
MTVQVEVIVLGLLQKWQLIKLQWLEMEVWMLDEVKL